MVALESSGSGPEGGQSAGKWTILYFGMVSTGYLQRCHLMLQMGRPAAEIAVYIGDFAPQMTGPANPVSSGYDYDYMGSDALLRTVELDGLEADLPDRVDGAGIGGRQNFFLSNFGKTGSFGVTLQVSDKAPELYNPVTGHTHNTHS